MTAALKPTAKAAQAPNPHALIAEPTGTIRLQLAPLGIDHQADDFPVRFIDFCERNDLYQMEVNAAGALLILPMTGFRGSRQETHINGFIFNWTIANGGIHASQTGRFRLPSGEVRGPDAAWMTQQRFDAQTAEQRETVINGPPDFVAETRSRTDSLRPLQNKMALWIAGGVRLGWLIDARSRQVHIYAPRLPNRKYWTTRKRWTAKT